MGGLHSDGAAVPEVSVAKPRVCARGRLYCTGLSAVRVRRDDNNELVGLRLSTPFVMRI